MGLLGRLQINAVSNEWVFSLLQAMGEMAQLKSTQFGRPSAEAEAFQRSEERKNEKNHAE